MRETMAGFFSNQLDFIFFFYGLAFILLGVTSFALASGKERAKSWVALGLFGLLHGFGEWLDLIALVIGDTSLFAVVRTALMTVSFVLLMEFARLEAIFFGLKPPGRWLYVLLLVGTAGAGFAAGLSYAGATARYSIGLVGAGAASWVFMRYATQYSGAAKNWATSAALGFALYGVAAGVIVPAAPFWPANIVNYDWFVRLTGTPIQLVRGLLATWLAYSIFAIWGYKLIWEVSSDRYTAYLRRQFVWVMAALATVFFAGWTLTEYLGEIYERNVQEDARGDIDLLMSRLAGETATVESMVKVLAGSPTIVPLLVGGSPIDNERAKSVLELHVQASGAKLGYILNASGAVVAYSDPSAAAVSDASNYRSSPYFQESPIGRRLLAFCFRRRERNACLLRDRLCPRRGGKGRWRSGAQGCA